jgi:hypothetical protein
MCELYEPWIQWLFMAGVALTSGHYKIDTISGVGYPRLDLVVPLVLCTVACTSWGTSFVLQVLQDNINPTENGYYLR